MKKTIRKSMALLAALLCCSQMTMAAAAQEMDFEPAEVSVPDENTSFEKARAESGVLDSEDPFVDSDPAEENPQSISSDLIVTEAMNGEQISLLLDSALASGAAENAPVISLVRIQADWQHQGLLPAVRLAQAVLTKEDARLIPAVILDTDLASAGPKYLLDFLEMYESLTGIRGYALCSGSAKEKADWSGWPDKYLRFDDEEQMKQQLSAADVQNSLTVPEGLDQTQMIYRLYNPNTGEHFYTASANEAGVLLNCQWRYESFAWSAGKEGTPIYRLYNPNDGGDHHYTTDQNEADYLVKAGWRDEGIAFFEPQEGEEAVYRVYNPNARVNNHHFTPSSREKDALIAAGWKDEGTAFASLASPIEIRSVKGGNYLIGDIGYSINQARLTGLQRVNGRPYLFDENGQMRRTQGLAVLDDGNSVYVQFDGTLAENGLISHDGKVSYFDSSCKMARNQTVRIGSLNYHFNAQGNWDNQSDVEIQKLCNEVYKKHGKDMKALYDYAVSFKYKTYPIHLTPPAGWTREQHYAKIGLSDQQGNCYMYASALTALLKNAGYNARYIEGGVRTRWGTSAPHGWVDVTIDGARYILDPELCCEYQEKGRYFYLQPIGSTLIGYIY